MGENGLLRRHGIVRSAIKKDLLFFALPALTVFLCALEFCARDGLHRFWGTLWDLIREPQNLLVLPAHIIIGLALFILGLVIAVVAQVTLWRNYSSTVLIRENHQLITHGIYRFTRNPIYLGVIVATIGLAVYAASLYGFLTMLLLIPIFLVRIRLEEKLLTEEFQDTYRQYQTTAKRLIPFIY